MKIKVALVDDHTILRNGLANLIDSYEGYHVSLQADNGKDLIEKLEHIKPENKPEIILLDLNMPHMNGMETIKWLKVNYPAIKILVLTMYNDDSMVVEAIGNGAGGYLVKDMRPNDLKLAMDTIWQTGFYYNEAYKDRLINYLIKNGDNNRVKSWDALSAQEKKFVALAASDLTYAEIAKMMKIKSTSLEAIRQAVFSKLSISSRVGLAIFAVQNKLIKNPLL